MVTKIFGAPSVTGDKVKSEIVWIKTTDDTHAKLFFGMGRYVRNCHETCLIATRGKATSLVQNKSVRSVFFAPRPKQHSQKPDEFFALVDTLFAGVTPRVELFARQHRPGWEGYGLELPGRPAAPETI